MFIVAVCLIPFCGRIITIKCNFHHESFEPNPANEIIGESSTHPSLLWLTSNISDNASVNLKWSLPLLVLNIWWPDCALAAFVVENLSIRSLRTSICFLSNWAILFAPRSLMSKPNINIHLPQHITSTFCVWQVCFSYLPGLPKDQFFLSFSTVYKMIPWDCPHVSYSACLTQKPGNFHPQT